jgi:hypothetical protein
VAARERGRGFLPEQAVRAEAVDEDERLAGAVIVVVDGARSEVNLLPAAGSVVDVVMIVAPDCGKRLAAPPRRLRTDRMYLTYEQCVCRAVADLDSR